MGRGMDYKGVRMQPSNITFLREVRPRKQGQLLLVSKKTTFTCYLYYNSSSNYKKFIQREKEKGKVCHLGTDPPS
jgi:hypothetical protein